MKHGVRSVAALTGLAAIISCGGGDVSGPAAALQVVSGNDQLGKPGSPLSRQVVVLATDPVGAPLAGVRVTWTAAAGSVSPPSATTSADGKAAASWTLGATEGLQEAAVTADNGARVTFQSTAVAAARPIAFGGREFMTQKLRMMNADGSGMVQVTTLPAWAPAWSPDGKRLAVMIGGPTSCSSTFGNLVVIDLSTVTETQLTQNDKCSRVGGPTWSPDGTLVAFVDHANKQIVLMGPDGSGKRSISIVNGVDPTRPVYAVTGPLLWYRDGSGLLFGGKGGGGDPGNSVWAINVDGTNLRQVQLDALYGTYPAAFSPDGSAVALGQQLDPHTTNLRIVVSAPSNLNAAQEVAGSTGILNFAWSPSGTQWWADVYGIGSPCTEAGGPMMVLYDYDATLRKVIVRNRMTICGAYAAWRP